MTVMTASVSPSRLGRVMRWLFGGARLLRADLRRRWVLFAIFALVWVLAVMRLFVHHTPVVPVLINWTPSIPYRVVYVDYFDRSLGRGDLIVYTFEGQAAERDYPGLRHQPFFKRIAGLPGDAVTVKDREVFVNGVRVGRAKTQTFDRRPLEPIDSTVIPPGFLYVQGTSPDSFDSRYRSSGLVRQQDVKAKVRPLI
jgi:conjugal transfer pilin signal peptidase TrbI